MRIGVLLVICLVACAHRVSGRNRNAQRRTPLRQAAAKPIPSFPSYPVVTHCPEEYGLQAYHNPDSCHQFYKCANGTLTEETCGNGLLFDGKGNIHNHCNYHWAVNCEGRAFELLPEGRANSACEYAYGIHSAGVCEDYYLKCAANEVIPELCTPGLAYDERIHGCNWADQIELCDAEKFVNFRCPEHLDSHDLAYRFLPFPRFAINDCHKFITCVESMPRLISCGDYNVFDPETLTCRAPEFVPKCSRQFK